MTGIVVVFPKIENARSIKNILVRSGYSVTAVCATGAQALSCVEGLNDGIVICGYRLKDMIYSELKESLPEEFELLLLASERVLDEYGRDDCLSIAMPLKVHELLSTVEMMVQNADRKRKRRRLTPRARDPKEQALIGEAKALLMERNHMTEEEAHRYIQKCSMDSSTNMVETAQMILSVMGL